MLRSIAGRRLSEAKHRATRMSSTVAAYCALGWCSRAGCGKNAIVQRMHVCVTCDYDVCTARVLRAVCEACAIRCHFGHEVVHVVDRHGNGEAICQCAAEPCLAQPPGEPLSNMQRRLNYEAWRAVKPAKPREWREAECEKFVDVTLALIFEQLWHGIHPTAAALSAADKQCFMISDGNKNEETNLAYAARSNVYHSVCYMLPMRFKAHAAWPAARDWLRYAKPMVPAELKRRMFAVYKTLCLLPGVARDMPRDVRWMIFDRVFSPQNDWRDQCIKCASCILRRCEYAWRFRDTRDAAVAEWVWDGALINKLLDKASNL